MPELFDASPYTATGDIRPTSPDRRRTARNNASIAEGYHPITGQRLIYVGATCRSCAHLFLHQPGRKRYWKCELNANRGPNTDVRVGWPACTEWRHDADD